MFHNPDPDSMRHQQQTMQLSQLLALDATDFYPLADNQHLVVNRITRQRGLIPDNLLPLLRLCGSFRTLEEHCDGLITSLAAPESSGEMAMALLNDLKNAGIMISAEQWLRRLQETSSAPAADDGDWALVIITCDRPALLHRLLESAIPHVTADIRPSKALLIDDSRQPESLAANRRSWSDWLERCGLSGEHWDRDARTRLSRMLGSRSPETARTVDWLLSPDSFDAGRNTTGQARNLALLLGVGQRLLLLDDDCTLAPQPPRSSDGLRVGSIPVDVVPYADREAFLRSMQPFGINPFEQHLRYLGTTLSRVFERLGQDWRDPAWLRDLDAPTRARLAADTTVRITVNATCGDPGTGSMDWLYTRSPENQARISEYLQQFADDTPIERWFWRGRSQPLLTFHESLMTTTLTGIDNRLLIPCIMPIGRGDDLMLGDGLRTLHPHAMFFIHSWALPHLPDPIRYWRRPAFGIQRLMVEPERFIAEIIGRGRVPHDSFHDPCARLQYLAARYRDFAAMTDPMLVSEIEKLYLKFRTPFLKAVTRNRTTGQPADSHWQHDLSLLIEHTTEAISEPLDLDADWLARFRDLCRRYADGLSSWPTLRQQVAEQRADLTRRVGGVE